MTLRIGKLATRCLVPRGQEEVGALVEDVAWQVLPRELSERLGPSLDRQPAVVRLRRLDVKLCMSVAELKRGNFAGAWANAVARALHEALARPEGEGEKLRRFESRAAYVAAMIVHASRGPPEGSWQFPELNVKAGRHPAIVVLDLLLESGAGLSDVLEELSREGKLLAALALLDEVGMERLVRAVAETEGGDGAVTAAQLIAIASALAAMRSPPSIGEAASRRQAIELWLKFGRETSLRGLWYGTRLLLRFLEEPALLAWRGARPPSGPARPMAPPHDAVAAGLSPPLAEIMARFPEWCERIRRQLQHSGRMSASAASALEALREITPSAAQSPRSAGPLWTRIDCAGLLLLYPIVRRLGWARRIADPAVGPRIFQALIAGAGMRLLRPWRPGETVEPAAALLGGMIEEPARLGIAQVLDAMPVSALDLFPEAADWPAALDAAADALALGLAARIRGFRTAGRESVVRHFLRVPGRVLIEENELRIVLEPSPWSVALHISGADDPLDGVEWLRRRRVVYVLEGL
jgi:hypothetical protein